ncbi:AMP-binding protein [bacterium]|nr:AMP-binding protein [bacterium]
MPVDRQVFNPKSADTSVFEALLAARRKHGGKKEVILDADDRRMTYDQLVRATLALGSALSRWTQAGEAVGVMLPTGLAAVVSFLALSAFGRVPAMLNFTSGARNLRAACKAGVVKRIVTAHAFIEKAELQGLVDDLKDHVELIYLEDVKAKLSLGDKLTGMWGALNPKAVVKPQAPSSSAVILFTSGTEGDPKGVVLSHANVVSNVMQVLAHVPEALTPDDVIFNALPTFHCFGLTAGALLPLLGGMKAVFYPSPLHTKIIPKRILETGSTILFATDTFLNQYMRAGSDADFQGLRFVVCGAERVREETRQAAARKFKAVLLEGYGATEASPVISVNQPLHNRPGSVGRPLPGMELRFESVPGITAGGRMFVRGPNVMRGYLRTEQPGVLVPPEDGWHDTGDIVGQDADGYLTIQGRQKRFAKIGGEMVSLAVVEDCASTLWAGHDHAAAVLPCTRKGEQIVLLTTNPSADKSDLHKWAQSQGVAELALPRQIHHVEAIPVLGTGKMDIGAVQRVASELSSPATPAAPVHAQHAAE